MREKTRRIILSIFLAASIVALMAASLAYTITHGRYTGGRLDAESPYDQIIDFVGATKYTVSSPEELVNAIENGYSYIEIGKDAPDPFVINSDIADVATNLVLNVNGHVVVRNSRNPLINVQKNVSVVLVYDSESDEDTPQEDMGGFYNPVGSALQASGGTLTVGQGKYESGPRAGDPQESVGDTKKEVNVYHRGGNRGAAAYTEMTEAWMPAGGKDMYFEDTPTSGGNDFIEKDTFLIYTEEKNGYIPAEGENAGELIVHVEENADGSLSGDVFSVPCNVASCDFYYYYPIEEGKTTVGEQEVQTYAVVYGYNDVKDLAKEEDTDLTQTNGREAGNVLVWPYAAIRSLAGSAYARGGEFYTHFGTENTYGIYSSGGIMTVGGEASAVPIFSAQGLGTCIYMAAEEAADGGQDKNILTIDSGEFSSEIGDTIEMHGGTMNIKSGSFTKDAAAEDNTKTAIIHMKDGKLIADGSVDGSGEKSIQMTCGGENVSLKNVFGVYSEGGTVSLQDVQIVVNGTYSAGVLAITGEQTASEKAYAVTVADSVIDVNFREDDLSSSGISTEGGNIQLKGSVSVTSQGLGITARTGSINIAAGGESEVDTPRGTGVYVNKGKLTVEARAALSVKSTVLGNAWVNPPEVSGGDITTHYDGVVVEGGSLVSEGTLNVTFRGVENDKAQKDESGNALTGKNAYRLFEIKSYAVRVEQAAAGGDTEVTITKGTISNAVGGGVYVGGGTVKLGEKDADTGPVVQTKGAESYADTEGKMDAGPGGNWVYYLPRTGGPAVKVTGNDAASSSLHVYGGTYTSQQGDGIVTVGGTSYIYSGTFIGRDQGAASGDRAGPGASYSFKVYGGVANVYGGTFGGQENGSYINSSGAFVMGTSADEKGTANIYGGTFVVSEGNAGGQAGFSVYEYGSVLVDPGKGGEQQNLGGNVVMTGLAVGMAIESNTSNTASVEIKGGSFSSTRDYGNSDGVWYSNANATLTISGGTFTGAVRSGLYFEVAPNENNVQLSGGTYYGSKNDLYAELRWGGNTIQTFGNHTQNNAIAGNASFDNILAESVAAYGDTQFDTSSIVSGLENFPYSYTNETVAGGTEQVLSGINSKAKVRIEYDYWITYHDETDLVYSKITIR